MACGIPGCANANLRQGALKFIFCQMHHFQVPYWVRSQVYALARNKAATAEDRAALVGQAERALEEKSAGVRAGRA